MKRFLSIMLIFILSTIFAGCTSFQYESASIIARPSANSAPLQGTWQVKECLTRTPGTPQESKEDQLMDMSASFSNNAFVFGDYIWNDIAYKTKKVSAEEYFLHSYEDAADKLDIKDKELYVVQVSSGEKFLYEFIKINDNVIAASIDSNLYYLVKTSDQFNNSATRVAGSDGPEVILGRDSDSKKLSTGIFISLRIPRNVSPDNSGTVNEEYRYQTYWVAFTGGILRPVLTAPDIFMPRKDGFWRVKSRKAADNSSASDTILAARVSAASTKSKESKGSGFMSFNESNVTRSRSILYVGNDFICFEDTYYLVDKSQLVLLKKELRTLPIDSMDETDGIRLSDIAGQNGTMAFEEALSDMIKNTSNSGIKSIDDSNAEQNFALYRKTGHWFLKGRINYGKEYTVPYSDFNLNLLPPQNMVKYDILQVPWKIIKDRIPLAVDAYTSPNKDLSLVFTRNRLSIYAINGNDISDMPLMQVSIPEGSSVIMAEWCTGNYMKSWEKAFVEYNTVKEVKQ